MRKRLGLALSSIVTSSLITLAAVPALAHLSVLQDLCHNVTPANNSWGTPCAIDWVNNTAVTNGACLFTQAVIESGEAADQDIDDWFGSINPNSSVYYSHVVAENHFTRIVSVDDILPGDLIVVRYVSGGALTGYQMVVEFAPVPDDDNPLRQVVGIIDSTRTPHGPTDSRWTKDAGGVHDQGCGYGDIVLLTDEDGNILGHYWSNTSGGSYYSQAARSLVVGRFEPATP